MEQPWKGVTIGLGAIAIVAGVGLFAWYWNLFTPDVVDQLEAGRPGRELTPDWGFTAAAAGLVLAALGTTAVLVTALKQRRVTVAD